MPHMCLDVKLLGSGILKEGDDGYIDTRSERHARGLVDGHSEWGSDLKVIGRQTSPVAYK